MTFSRWCQGAVMLVLSVATIACGARSINQVLADPARYRNQSITVRGTVAESVSVLGRGAYRIIDQDQGLWVVTQSGAPRKGARVDVKGRLQDAYDVSAFGGLLKLPGSLQSGLVLLEESHRAR
jgi:membrane protein implicated in regulation of membrane protease activity